MQFWSYYGWNLRIERIGKICILSIDSQTPTSLRGTIQGFPDWVIPLNRGCGCVAGDHANYSAGEIYMDTNGSFSWWVNNISVQSLYTGQIIYIAKNEIN